MRLLILIFFLITIPLQTTISADDEIDLTYIPYDLFSDPTSYVDGVNVISGHFTYSTTDMNVQGPKKIAVRRTYMQGHSGSLGQCWETSLASEFELLSPSNKAQITHGPLAGLKFALEGDTLKLDPKVYKKGMSNSFGRINGKTHPKNTRIKLIHSIDRAQISTGSGSIIDFQKKHYKLKYQWFEETHPDGFKTHFDGTTLSTSTRTALKQPMIIQEDLREGRTRLKIYREAISKRKVKNYFQKIDDDLLLARVEGPSAPDESYSYTQMPNGTYCLSQISKPEGRYTFLKYIHEGKNCGKVEAISEPANSFGMPVVLKRFIYDKYSTIVINAANVCTLYQFDKEYRLKSYKKDFRCKTLSTDSFKWGEGDFKGNLLGRIHYDANDQPQFCRNLEYDLQGNVICETLWGNLTGKNEHPLQVNRDLQSLDNSSEHISKYFEYSQDGLNLLLKEKDARKEICYTYLPGSNLITSKITLAAGIIQQRNFYSYNSDGYVVREIEDNGTSWQEAHLEGVTERRIQEITYTQQAPYGLKEQVTEKYLDTETGIEITLNRKEFAYSPEGYLTHEHSFDSQDNYIGSIIRHYDKKGNVVEEYNALGHCTKKRYDPNGNLVWQQGPRPDTILSFEYDNMNRLTKETEILPSGQSLEKKYSYDLCSNKTSSIDIYGNETNYNYDALGRLIEITYPPTTDKEGNVARAKEKYQYNTLNQLVEKIDANGNTTAYQRNIRGDIVAVQHPDGTAQQYRYTLEGWLEKETDAHGLSTIYKHDYQGRIVETSIYSSEQLLKQKTATYNSFHLLSETDAQGLTTTHTYDSAGRRLSTIIGERKTTFAYDLQSRIQETKEFLHNGYRITIEIYDPLDRLVEKKVVDEKGILHERTCYTYDENNNCISTLIDTDNGPAITQKEFDSQGNITRLVDPEGNIEISYNVYQHINENGQRVASLVQLDPLKNKTLTLYDARQRVSRIVKYDPQDNVLHVSLYNYDFNNNIDQEVEVIHSSESPLKRFVIARTYDSLNRPLSVSEGDGLTANKTTHYTYTKTGQRSSLIKPDGIILNYSYDLLGRLASIISSDKSIHYLYQYDLNDNILSVEDLAHQKTTTREYDPYGNVISEKLANGLSLHKTYDAFNRVLALKHTEDTLIEYSYNAAHLVSVTRNGKHRYNHTYKYDHSGKPIAGLLPFDTGVVEYNYDLNLRCLAIHSPSYQEEITYDRLGHVISKKVQRDNAHLNYQYGYDNLHNLTEESGANTHQYQFDSIRNRIQKDESSQTINSLNQLINDEETQYQYDLNGNLTAQTTKTHNISYTYDALNRLIKVQTPTKEYSYTYDPFNRRLSKSDGTQTLSFLYDANHEIGSVDTHGNFVEFRILGLGHGAEIGSSIAIEIQNEVYIPIHDHAGNIIQLLNAQGKDVDNYFYTAYGEEIAHDNAIANPWKFSSKRNDQETSFIYYGERFYNPKTGRWLTPDPAGYLDSNNLYAFVHNNPLKYIDPDGRVALTVAYTVVVISFDWVVTWITAEAVLTAATVTYGGYVIYNMSENEDGIQCETEEKKKIEVKKDPERTEPKNLNEQLALEVAKNKDRKSKEILPGEIKDPKYPPEIWLKGQYNHKYSDGKASEFHYWEHRVTGERHGFKFKDNNARKKPL